MRLGNLLLSALLLTTLAGCECGPPVQRQYADIRWLPSDRLVVDGDEAVLDFGSIPFGTTQTASATLQNAGLGRGTVTVASEPSAPFAWDSSTTSLSRAEAHDLSITAALPAEETLSRDMSARLLIDVADGVAPGESNQRTLVVRARGFRFNCELPDEIDFGLVRVGEHAQRPLEFANSSDGVVQPVLLPNQNMAFNWQTPLAPVGPRSSLSVEITFTPMEPGEALGTLRAIGGPGCPEQAIRLKGRAVQRWLEWQPTTIDCGWVLRDETRRTTLTFTNHSTQTVTLSSPQVTGPASVLDWPTTISSGESTAVSVDCRPTELGLQVAAIDFHDDLDGAATIPVLMKGGGPRIAATPQPMSFGATAVGVRTTRTISISNTGAVVPDAGVDANLLLDNDGGTPIVVTSPRLTITSAELYRPELGLAEGEALQFHVSIAPDAPGPWNEFLSFHSNDPRQPVYNVIVTGNGLELPPCELTSSTTSLDFGVLYMHEIRSRAVTFHNTGTANCLLSALDIDLAGKAAGFSLRGGRIEALELLADQRHTAIVDVRAFPMNSAGPQNGALELEVSNAGASNRRVDLRANSAAVCASTEPDPVDFGDVPIGCRLARRITTTNICVTPFAPWPYSTTGAPFSVDAGQPPVLVSPDSHVATVFFKPVDAGVFEGQATIGVPGGLRRVPLLGRGVYGSTVSESFTQRANANLEVLYSARLGGHDPLDGGSGDDDWPTYAIADGINQLVDAGVNVRAAVVVGDWDHMVNHSNNLPWTMGELLRLGDAGTYVADNEAAAPHVVTQRLQQREAIRRTDGRTLWFSADAHFEAIYQAATPPKRTTLNVQFWNTSAPKLFVIASTGPDVSSSFRDDISGISYPHPAFSVFPVEYYRNRYDILWGRGNYIFVYMRSLGVPACSWQWSDFVYGRYRDMAQLTGGFPLEVCGTPISDQLATQTLNWLGVHRRRFQLRGQPDVTAPIVVSLNGAALPIADWTYDEPQNAVVLNTAPAVGTQVTVTYFPRCE